MMTNFIDFVVYYNWELIILLLFTVLQSWWGQIPTIKNLDRVAGIFPDHYDVNVEEKILQIAKVEGYDIYNMLCSNINNYIRGNSESIDIHQMKDTVNRLVENEYEQATSKLSVPMYLGLMGTYFGVGFGLFWLVVSGFENTESVSKFVGGVIVAMFTSLFGLGMTTYCNHKAAKVLDKVNSDRDKFIAFLETAILPEMPSTLAQTLKNELQKSIGTFGNTVVALNTTISTLNSELKKTFEKVTSEFGENLTRNLSSLKNTVSMLNTGTSSQMELIKMQGELLSKISSREFSTTLDKMTTSVEKSAFALSQLDSISSSFENMIKLQRESSEVQTSFITAQKDLVKCQGEMSDNIVNLDSRLRENVVEYSGKMSQITLDSQKRMNELLAEPNRLFSYIERVVEEFRRVEQFVESVTVDEYKNNNERMGAISSQLNEIKRAGELIKAYLNNTSSDMESYLDSQREEIKSNVEKFTLSWNEYFSRANADESVDPMAHFRKIEILSNDVENIKMIIERDDIRPLLEGITNELRKLNEGGGVIGKRGFFSSIFSKR